MDDKEVSTQVSDEELALLIEENKKRQEKENEGDGVKADYILLAKTGTKALKKSVPDLYIPELKVGDFFLQKEKKVLGDEIKVVPLAFITLYNERENDTKDAKFFGVWNKEQATKFDLVEGSYFNRQHPNGHILVPVNWVMVEVVGHPEIENAVIAYKATGSRIWRKWKEDAKNRSSSSATLVYTLREMDVSNQDNSWTDIGFAYTESLLETDKALAVKCLKKSNALRKSYEEATLIGNRTIEAGAPKAIADNREDLSDTEESFDDADF